MATAELETKLPPYVSFETFSGLIERLNKTVVPSHIDKSIMGGLSGGVQSHLMSCLRSLGLVSDEGVAMAEFRSLVQAYGTDSWPSVLGGVVKRYYSAILGSIDITTATSKQLEQRFDEAGNVKGSMADRAIRFYIRALEESKIPFSPHLKIRKQRGTRKASGGTNRGSSGGGALAAENRDPPTEEAGMMVYTLYFKRIVDGKPVIVSGRLVVPNDLTKKDCGVIRKQVDVLELLES